MIDQRAAPPVLRDVAEHPVFDLIPLARPRREVAHRDPQAGLIGQLLQLHLPETATAPVRAAAIGSDQQLGRTRIHRASHVSPPPPQRLDGELGRVMIDAHAHPAGVGRQVVHPVGDRLAQLRVQEIMDADLFGATLGLPLPSAVLEVADQFLLLGVHRDDRLAPPLIRLDPSVDVLELGVAVGMAAAFPGLAVGLEAVTELAQQSADRPGTDCVTLAAQLNGQLGGTLAGPAQWRLGVATGRRLDQRLQAAHQARIVMRQRLPSPAGAADTSGHAGWIGRAAGLTQLPQSGPDGHVSHAGGLGDPGDPSTADGRRLGRRPEARGGAHRGRA